MPPKHTTNQRAGAFQRAASILPVASCVCAFDRRFVASASSVRDDEADETEAPFSIESSAREQTLPPNAATSVVWPLLPRTPPPRRRGRANKGSIQTHTDPRAIGRAASDFSRLCVWPPFGPSHSAPALARKLISDKRSSPPKGRHAVPGQACCCGAPLALGGHSSRGWEAGPCQGASRGHGGVACPPQPTPRAFPDP